MRVAVLGLGAMGSAIARRLLEADVQLVVYNRSRAPTREVADRRVRVAQTGAEAARESDVAISVLSDSRAVEAVLLGPDGVLELRDPSRTTRVMIDMSTIDVATSQRVADCAGRAGIAYLRAPVSGNPSVVAAGNLTILVSGDEHAFEACRALLTKIGPTLFYLGGAEEARVMKLALNLMLAGTMELLAEALVMGEANGLARAQMLEVIAGSAVGSPFVSYKSAPLVADDYSSSFSAKLMHKDLRLVIECANGADVPVPVAALIQQLMQGCIGAGMGELDFSVLVRRLQHEAGQDGATPTAALPEARRRRRSLPAAGS
jgi:3-hydroxyisobutyrate dehydrogenase-like beta-hydroxyacid dehydrogenase